jgi:hypothetical protein
LLTKCGSDGVADGGTETGNARVIGALYNPDGTPAENAVAHFIPATYQPYPATAKSAAVSYSAVTNEDGRYTLDSLPAGYYNVFGEGGGNLSFQDSVLIGQRSEEHTSELQSLS